MTTDGLEVGGAFREEGLEQVRFSPFEGTGGRVMHPRVERRYSLSIPGFRPTQSEAIAQIPQDHARPSIAPPAGHGSSPLPPPANPCNYRLSG
jgi:hypothetical protein